MTDKIASLPLVIAGPMVRHISQNTFTLWLVTSQSIEADVYFFEKAKKQTSTHSIKLHENKQACEKTSFQVGDNCYIHTLIVEQDNLFKEKQLITYDVKLLPNNSKSKKRSKVGSSTDEKWLSEHLPTLLYAQQTRFTVQFNKNLRNIMHGSCRKPHFTGKDALPQIDAIIAQNIAKTNSKDEPALIKTEKEAVNSIASLTDRPDLMLFTGDQVYIDDVAGPMLFAIEQVITLLGLYHERFEGSTLSDSQALLKENCYYKRESLLPDTDANKDLTKSFFKGKRKPIFTSVNASNHLIALNEMIALYLLCWSSRLWEHIQLDTCPVMPEYKERYQFETKAINNFVAGLPAIERSFAHVSIYMIFDDHDVTDDWNLTRAWEEHVYGNAFSKRIVGNALSAYFLFQGIGNPDLTWRNLLESAHSNFCQGEFKQQDVFIERLLEHDNWQYRLDTCPPIQVLDTRTQRWRSESNKNKPSGLMDWEGLCALQQDVIGKDSVIMVSPAPVYGVKFIETIQRLFSFFGGALIVDAENWMAHRGTASVMLNIFRHVKTPPHFIILSGDVHYSFVYDVSLKFKRNSPKIVQFTCSGIHNQFPDKLIKWFERLNRWLYGHRSPLNWLTKRRNMSVKEREASTTKKDIVNATSIGFLELDEKGHEQACKLILADGNIVSFTKAN